MAWLIVLFILKDRHPRVVDDSLRLGPGRKGLAILLAILFVACFMPLPLRFI